MSNSDFEFKYIDGNHPEIKALTKKDPRRTPKTVKDINRISLLTAIGFTDTVRIFGPLRAVEVFDELIDELLKHIRENPDSDGDYTYNNEELIEILQFLEKGGDLGDGVPNPRPETYGW